MNNADFYLEPRNKFVEANRSIVEYEIRPGNTVSFLQLVDLSHVEALRAAMAERSSAKPSYTAFVVKALALAMQEFPYANRRVCRNPWIPLRTQLQRFKQCDIAVACERILPGAECLAFVDVLRNADKLSLNECTQWLRQLSVAEVETNSQWRQFSTLISRLPHWLSTLLIRSPYLSPRLWAKYRGGAAIVSSPAKYGVDAVTGTWSWPLGVSFGLVKPRSMVKGNQVVPCPSFYLTLNFDRRIMAGAQAARFFSRMVEALQEADTQLTSCSLAKQGGQV